jgi:hypothetical protein
VASLIIDFGTTLSSIGELSWPRGNTSPWAWMSRPCCSTTVLLGLMQTRCCMVSHPQEKVSLRRCCSRATSMSALASCVHAWDGRWVRTSWTCRSTTALLWACKPGVRRNV